MALAMTGAASAAPSLKTAKTLFEDGAYSRAAAHAEATAYEPDANNRLQAESFALAARSGLTQYFLEPYEDHAPVILDGAEDQARAAIEADPAFVEGYLELALALGYRGRRLGPLAAHMEGFAREARAAIDKAMQLAPDSPYANAILGAWHLEIVGNAGAPVASIVYQASLEDGMAAFNKARALDPDNLLFDVQYAAALLMIHPRAFRGEVRAAVETALTKKPHNALERRFADIAKSLKLKLDSENDEVLRRYLLCVQAITEAKSETEE